MLVESQHKRFTSYAGKGYVKGIGKTIGSSTTSAASEKADDEGKCGEGKCGEGKCGGETAEE